MKNMNSNGKSDFRQVVVRTLIVFLLVGGGAVWAGKQDGKIQLKKDESAAPAQKAPDRQQVPDPFRDLFRLQQEMDRLFGTTLNPYWDYPEFTAIAGTEQQAMDLNERPDAYTVQMDLPGFSKPDIAIEVKDNVLTVSAERKESKDQQQDGKMLIQERSVNSLRREVVLPKAVNVESVTAEYKDGVLTITLPKTEQDQAVRKVEIK